MTLKTALAAFAMFLLPVVAQAHEFWIEPKSYQVDVGDAIEARLRVGEEFEGSEQSYLPRNIRRFDTRCAGIVAKVPGRAGDRPALSVSAPEDGLCVVIHATQYFEVIYREWAKFLRFAEHKDFPNAATEHAARGLSQDEFSEIYSRHAKSLIAVGSGAGSDSIVGLTTEIVAEANPYTDTMSGGLPIRVFYNGRPRANAQVELFAKSPSGSVEITLHRTNNQGRVRLPVRKGYSYLADAVVLRAVDPASADGAVWETLWASLTFAVPE